jgi:enediyne biosynthesis protein E4
MTLNRRSALKLLGSGLFAGQFAGAMRRTTPGGLLLEAPIPAKSPLGYSLTDVAQQAGIHFNHVCGGDAGKKYILETTGSGVAFIDYDNDGWQDIFLVNGSRLAGFPAGQEPSNRLFHNNRDGTFTDVTTRAGLSRSGWGQGVCIGDYDNDGYEDIFVTYWGKDVLYHNNGDGTFTDVTRHAGVGGAPQRWSTGCSFVDYDRDGHLDLFVTHYVKFDLQTAIEPGSNPYCVYRGMAVNCGPRGLVGEKSTLYRNNKDGTFTDVTTRSGLDKAPSGFGLGVLSADYDNDGWPDIYVSCDSTPSLLFMNNHDGTFREEGPLRGVAYGDNGQLQAGMGVAAADFDHNGWLDILKMNFSDETPNLYVNSGKAMFNDMAQTFGINRHQNLVGWGCGFFDPDNDGLLDIFYVNGHVYPELDHIKANVTYRQPRVLYRNLGDGRFEDVSADLGPCITAFSNGRGCAFGDFNNDGNIDILINNQNSTPALLRCDGKNQNHWLTVKLKGARSNRSGIGARVSCVSGALEQVDEVRSGGSYLSQNDLRVHFGVGEATTIDVLEVRWPSGVVDTWRKIPVDQFLILVEGGDLKRHR